MAIFRLNGVHVKHCKNTAKMKAERIPVPASVSVPMSMHIGVPARPVVKVGDEVVFGGLLGSAPIMPVNTYSPAKFIARGGRIPAPIHSLKN